MINLNQEAEEHSSASQIVEKHAFGGFFNEFAPFAYEPTARRAANGDRNPLLRKGSETAVHAAGFGRPSEGCAPPIPPGVCQQSERQRNIPLPLTVSSVYFPSAAIILIKPPKRIILR